MMINKLETVSLSFEVGGSHGRVSGHPYKPKGCRPEPLGGLGACPPGKCLKLDPNPKPKSIFQHSE